MPRHLLCALVCLLVGILPATSVSADIVISEFSIGGTSRHADDDFIELLNTGTQPVSLHHWQLKKRTQGTSEKAGTESSVRELGPNDCIAPGKTFLWVSSKATSDYQDLANTLSSATLTSNNSLALLDDQDKLQDAIIFGSGHSHPFPALVTLSNPDPARAHARDPLTLLWQENLTPTPTGGSPESCATTPSDPASTPSPPSLSGIRINEIFPDPSAPQDQGEYIELYNAGMTDVDLSGWKITDATKTGRYTFPAGTPLAADHYLALTDQDFSFSLNNSRETLSLFNTQDILQDTVSYSKTSKDVSLNWTSSGWRGSKTLTPGQPNILSNTLPTTRERVPKKGFQKIFLDFRARGQDQDGDTLKYVWDFGDGHKSYKSTTRHRYDKTGTYTVTLTTRDGSEETLETFSLEIKNFDPPKLRLTALLPNPNGSDTAPGAEWIEIENHTKKDVDLLGYSLATGWKKLVNHPIRESFVIPKKSTRKLTREVALFTLPNEKGRIELRAPNGSVIHALKYKFSQSLADDTVLKKEKGKRLAPVLLPEKPPEISVPTTETPESTEALVLSSEEPTVSDIPPLTSETENPTSPVQPRATPLIILTTQGTSLTLSPTLIQEMHAPQKKQEEPLPASDDTSTSFLKELSLQANTWLNALSLDQGTGSPQSE